MPSSRNASAPASASLPGSFLSAAPAASPLAAAIDKVPGGRLTLLIAGALIAVGGISTGLILRSHKTAPAPRVVAAAAPPPAAAPATNFPLLLQLEPQDKGQINVRWNPQSTLIAQSREGRLVITENNQKPRTIPLALDQLKFGHLTYQPQTDRVEFRLEVVDPSGSVAEESVLSLANPPAPGGSARNPQATPPAANATLTTGAQKIGAPPAPAAAANGNRPAARTFTPPSLNRTPEQGSIVDAPPVLTTNTAAPAPLVNLQVPRAVAPPPLVANAPAPRQLQVESSLQAAKLIKKITPAYPPLAKSARVQGTIHFKATIGKDGTVQNLETVGGPALLRQSAIDAVKQWKYQPTVLNGQPVEVVTSIDVLFTLGQ
jgi:TonB family protein